MPNPARPLHPRVPAYPPVRIPSSAPLLGKEERRQILRALSHGWVSSRGPLVEEFERRFAAQVQARYAVATTSGTTALHLALASVGVGEGDEVILPDATMVACLDAVLYTGARPVLVDVDPATWTLDATAVSRAITRRTRAVMPVHLYGHPADMGPLVQLAAEHGFVLVEDAAEAHGAEYLGRPVGGIGTVGCFSFYANKIITTGEGGMVVTNSRRLAERARRLRDLGSSGPERSYRHAMVGYNYRLTNLQAALGLAQLGRFRVFVEHRRACAFLYQELLEGLEPLGLPSEAPWAHSVFWMYTVRLTQGSRMRRRLVQFLRSKGIETRPGFWPLHRQPFLSHRWAGRSLFPIADRIGRTALSLPSGNGIELSKVEETARLVRNFLRRESRGSK